MMYFIIIYPSHFEYFLSVKKCCIKVKNKVWCIIICYCGIKLEKWGKSYQTVEDICPGKMMILQDINDNILIYHSSYSGVYQENLKMRALPRDSFLGWNQTKKTDETVLHVTHAIINI